jgi:NAD(P)-dependent dehydrogenase (short-subunit alcohol dehydrogenase family)
MIIILYANSLVGWMSTGTGGPLRGRHCLVTGGTGGIGLETATGLARQGARLTIVGRTPVTSEAAARAITSAVPGASVSVHSFDLAVRAEVIRLVEAVRKDNDRLDVLVNNAGVSPFARRVTKDGLEETLATNHLAPFLLTAGLLPLMKSSGPSRVVNVTSSFHKRTKAIPWDDLQGERTYNPFDQYSLTKLLNLQFTYELSRRLAGTTVTANAADPGFVRTRLARGARGGTAFFYLLMRPMMVSAAKGARTSIFLASDPSVQGVTGRCFAKCREVETSPLSHDEDSQRRIWDVTERLTAPPW